MYTFNLSRKKVCSQQDNTVIGYNYYLLAYVGKELTKQELLHTSIGMENPLDSGAHDIIARQLYQDFIHKTEKLTPNKNMPRPMVTMV